LASTSTWTGAFSSVVAVSGLATGVSLTLLTVTVTVDEDVAPCSSRDRVRDLDLLAVADREPGEIAAGIEHHLVADDRDRALARRRRGRGGR
jgi:hypothetical protein